MNFVVVYQLPSMPIVTPALLPLLKKACSRSLSLYCRLCTSQYNVYCSRLVKELLVLLMAELGCTVRCFNVDVI